MKQRAKNITAFQKYIWDFYTKNRRDFAWRNTKNPYKITVSEIMLQQTQVSRVAEKFPLFLREFPTIEALAKAPTGEVLRVWQGMGYNRRALALKRLAEDVVHHHNGKLPRSREALESLPGIGHYTAGAIRAFAFNEPEVFIETNIRRVFIHHFFNNQEGIHDRDIFPLVEEALDRSNPREWYGALMDYGTHLAKTTPNPNIKSRHYTKQKAFKGSHREIRGKILKFLTGTGKSTVVACSKALSLEPTKAREVLNELLAEGFVEKQKTSYAIKH